MPNESVSTTSLAIADAPKKYTGKKLRVAIIGCGGIAQTHLKAFSQMPEVEVVAGVDIAPSRLDHLQNKWGVRDVYTDWKVMLKKVQPDAVDVCTPNIVHCAPVVDACNSGAHAIIEKPMAMSPAECEKMIAAAKKNKVKLAAGFQFRFHPTTDFLTRARDEGEFGKIMFVKCQALRRRGIPNWGVFGQKKLQGGGPLIDIGVHVIEMAHYFMGAPQPIAASGNVWTYLGDKPSKVLSQWPGWDHKTYTVEDLAIGQVRFANGAIMQIEASFAAHIDHDLWTFSAMGDKGGCAWDPAKIYTDRAGTMINSEPTFTGNNNDFDSLFVRKIQNWVDACLHNVPLRADGEAGLAVQQIIDGVYRSASAGKEVKI